MALLSKRKEQDTNSYTKKVMIPHYQPNLGPTDISSTVDFGKYSKLLKEINESNVSDEEKDFLRLAATRHIVFNYSKIADYYVQATPEMQDLMEKSALVILDVDDAIANGYVKFSDAIKKILKDSGVIAGEE